jgi:hypothetical protein
LWFCLRASQGLNSVALGKKKLGRWEAEGACSPIVCSLLGQLGQLVVVLVLEPLALPVEGVPVAKLLAKEVIDDV